MNFRAERLQITLKTSLWLLVKTIVNYHDSRETKRGSWREDCSLRTRILLKQAQL
jgi:hypothetical protein